MRLSDIDVFLTVIEEKSVNKAADKLFLTQPTVSRILLRIEDTLGDNLFDKTGYPWKLTPIGNLFLDTAIKISDIKKQFEENATNLSVLKQQKIVVSSMFFEEQYLLPSVIKAFNLVYPDIEILVVDNTTANMEKDLLEKKVDFAIVVLPLINPSKLDFFELKTYDILLMVPLESLLAKNYKYPTDGKTFPKIELSLLAEERFILMKEGFLLRNLVLDTFKHFEFNPKFISEVYNLEAARILTTTNHGNTFVFDPIAKVHKTTGAYFKIKDFDITQKIGLAFVKGRKITPIEKAFLDILKKVANSNTA